MKRASGRRLLSPLLTGRPPLMPTVTAKTTPLFMETMRPHSLRPRATSSSTPRGRSRSSTPSCTPPTRRLPYGKTETMVPWTTSRALTTSRT
eukprot:14877112-Heterocapsa_arctica.AAC.1